MKAREAKRVWDRVFPIKVGSRVKVVKFRKTNGQWLKNAEVIGRMGIVTEIAKGDWYPYRVQFDGYKNSYPFQEEELEIV